MCSHVKVGERKEYVPEIKHFISLTFTKGIAMKIFFCGCMGSIPAVGMTCHPQARGDLCMYNGKSIGHMSSHSIYPLPSEKCHNCQTASKDQNKKNAYECGK